MGRRKVWTTWAATCARMERRCVKKASRDRPSRSSLSLSAGMPHRYSAPLSSAQPATLTSARGCDKRAPKSMRNTWPCENSSWGSGGRWRSMMAATSICSNSGATTAKGPRLQAARCSTVPDQEMHMEAPSRENTREMDRQERPIEVLIHGRRARSDQCQEKLKNVIHAKNVGKVFRSAVREKRQNCADVCHGGSCAENETNPLTMKIV